MENLRETFINQPADHNNRINFNNKNSINNSIIDSKDAKILKDLQKRFSEIEKSFKTFSASINIELINKDLKDLHENLNSKMENSYQKVIDLSDNLSKKII